jgi:hypothetical protein
MATPSRNPGALQPNNKGIKSVPGLWPSTGRPCQGAAYGWRWTHREKL